MADAETERTERVQKILTALLERRLTESLTALDGALVKWREGEKGAFEAHADVLRHAARTERLAERMAKIGPDSAAELLRDAFDAGLVEHEEFVELVGGPPESVEPPPSLDEEGQRTPGKRQVVEDLLSAGPVLVHIDARREEVDVPDRFRGDAKLVLRFGYNLTPSIVDLAIDDQLMTGTLTFGGVPHRCVLPWPAVYAVVSEVDQKGMVWPEDVPASVVDQLAPSPEEREEEPPKRGSHLKLVK